MHAGLITGTRRLDLVEVPEPVAAPGHAVVAIERCGICGTDVAAYRSGLPYTPFLHGHEWCATVLEVGDGVRTVSPGDRVVCGAPEACGTCASCRAGRPGTCLGLMDLRGPNGEPPPPHGGYAPRIALDALVPIPVTLSPEAAGQVEPCAVAHHGLGRTPLGPDDLVVVQGCGPIGLGADVVLDCAGSGPALDAAVTLARTGGQVTMIGVSSVPVTITPGLWLVREITVAASLAHTRHDFRSVIDMLSDGRLVVEPLHSATVGLDELDAALADLADSASGRLKVLVDPTS